MVEYDIEVDTMNGTTTYKFKSESYYLQQYLEESMQNGNIETAIGLQNENIKFVGYWDCDDNYIKR